MKTTHESRERMRAAANDARRKNHIGHIVLADMIDVLLNDIEEILSGAISIGPVGIGDQNKGGNKNNA